MFTKRLFCKALLLAALVPSAMYAASGIERIELRVEGMT